MSIHPDELTANPEVLNPERLEVVRSSGLLDSPPEEAFDRLTRLAARLTGAPVTFLSVVDENRDFYKSCFGFPEPLASGRELTGTTFCHYAMMSDGPLVINDTLANPLYAEVPTVKSLGVRAYLGVPLVMSTGHVLGSFCAIDFAPREWTPLDVDVMRELAASTLREIELRRAVEAERETQKKLSGERRLLEAAMRQMPAGVMISTAAGTIVLSNERARQIVGRDIPEISLEGPPGSGTPLARAVRDGSIVHAEEIEFRHPDGSDRVISVSATPVRGEEGIAGVITIDDITDARRASKEKERLLESLDQERARLQTLLVENQALYDEARRANQAKDDFFAAVTHELRTPMTAILGWTRLLKMESLNSPDAIEAADMIESSARVQARLVDDLLDVSRIAAGKISLDRRPLDVNDVIGEAMRAADPAAVSQGIRLRCSLGDSPSISADRSRLRQIFGNLLSNSIKFTPSGGLIEISSTTNDSVVEIAVRDTGRGIAPELLTQIFDRGRQARDAEQGGLGLGLTIVRHLVEMHGGTIRATSEGAGMGSTFVVTLPV